MDKAKSPAFTEFAFSGVGGFVVNIKLPDYLTYTYEEEEGKKGISYIFALTLEN